MRYQVNTSVVDVIRKFKKVWISGMGDEAVFEEQSLGWFLHLRGSHETIFLGHEEPDFKAGDPVKESMTEYERAIQWREKLGLTKEELANAIGYSPLTIYWFDRGETPPRRNMKSGSISREIKPWVWLRYKMACAGLSKELSARKKFDW